MRSPSVMAMSVAVSEQDPGFLDRARLQNGVWLQLRNSSFFHDVTVVRRWRVMRSSRRRESVRIVAMDEWRVSD